MTNGHSPIRVLHCPGLVGGHAQQLARTERALGIHSWAVALEGNVFSYTSDEVLWPTGTGRLRKEAKRLHLLWRALREFDVIHFNYGMTLTPQLFHTGQAPAPTLRNRLRSVTLGLFELKDLQLLKRAGKRIVVTFQGDDARQGDYCRAHFEPELVQDLPPGYYTPESDAHKRWRIAQFARHADHIFALNPDLLRVLPARAEFLPYAHIDLNEWRPSAHVPGSNETPLVIHAPTHRGIKGTRHVLDTVARLKDAGAKFRFELVEGLSRAEARRLYEQADLLIDQLLLGWYGGLAVELMALGKPVICFLRADDLRLVPSALRADLPIIQATPATLGEVLMECLTTRRRQLATIGQRSRAFVERWHDPVRIAQSLINVYQPALHK